MVVDVKYGILVRHAVMQTPGAPLEIDTISVGVEEGVIGMCCCPGRIEQHNDGAHRQRDLIEDLAMVGDWQPDLVVSLVELHEFGFLGVAQLPEEFERRFQWQHYPVRDLAAPVGAEGENSALSQWFGSVCRGDRILLHCAAGLGRTGTVAARLLMLAGEKADVAIKRVRTARPGAIESASQERFLHNPG